MNSMGPMENSLEPADLGFEEAATALLKRGCRDVDMASAEIHNDLTPLAPGKLPAQLLASTGVPISQAPQTWRRNNCFTSLKRVQQVLADAQAQLPTDQQKPAFDNAAIFPKSRLTIPQERLSSPSFQ